jgi:hypothetical protein
MPARPRSEPRRGVARPGEPDSRRWSATGGRATASGSRPPMRGPPTGSRSKGLRSPVVRGDQGHRRAADSCMAIRNKNEGALKFSLSHSVGLAAVTSRWPRASSNRRLVEGCRHWLDDSVALTERGRSPSSPIILLPVRNYLRGLLARVNDVFCGVAVEPSELHYDWLFLIERRSAACAGVAIGPAHVRGVRGRHNDGCRAVRDRGAGAHQYGECGRCVQTRHSVPATIGPGGQASAQGSARVS